MRWRYALLVCFLSSGGGCSATHLAYVYRSTAGLEVKAAPSQGNVRLSIGYDRSTFAIVPRTAAATTQSSDAMSVVAVSRVELSGPFGINKFGHAVATGDPAISIATQPSKLQDVANGVFNDDATGKAGGQ